MHSGWFSCLHKKLVLCDRYIVTCSFLDIFKPGFHSPLLGLLCRLFQFCHPFLYKNISVLIFRPVDMIFNLSGAIFSGDLAAESALSFPE